MTSDVRTPVADDSRPVREFVVGKRSTDIEPQPTTNCTTGRRIGHPAPGGKIGHPLLASDPLLERTLDAVLCVTSAE